VPAPAAEAREAADADPEQCAGCIPRPPRTPPSANAGADQTVFEQTLVSLYGSGSGTERDVEELLALASSESDSATSLYEFTSLINEHCGYAEKTGLIRNMWRIAWADSRLDKYEDYVIRKVCDLIHVSHGDFILAKLAEKKRRESAAS